MIGVGGAQGLAHTGCRPCLTVALGLTPAATVYSIVAAPGRSAHFLEDPDLHQQCTRGRTDQALIAVASV